VREQAQAQYNRRPPRVTPCSRADRATIATTPAGCASITLAGRRRFSLSVAMPAAAVRAHLAGCARNDLPTFRGPAKDRLGQRCIAVLTGAANRGTSSGEMKDQTSIVGNKKRCQRSLGSRIWSHSQHKRARPKQRQRRVENGTFVRGMTSTQFETTPSIPSRTPAP
jgi:hypothetical protein